MINSLQPRDEVVLLNVLLLLDLFQDLNLIYSFILLFNLLKYYY